LPAHATALGKALLAERGPAALDALLQLALFVMTGRARVGWMIITSETARTANGLVRRCSINELTGWCGSEIYRCGPHKRNNTEIWR
jgi:DNA-binding IclR family transcriptional regulator